MKISSVGKKVAIGVGAAAAVGVTALAYAKGKKNLAGVDSFVNSKGAKKAGMALSEGFASFARAAQLNLAKLRLKFAKGALTDGQVKLSNEIDARAAFENVIK